MQLNVNKRYLIADILDGGHLAFCSNVVYLSSLFDGAQQSLHRYHVLWESLEQLFFKIMFYHACQSAVGHIM